MKESKEFKFDKLTDDEKKLLLSAFYYEVDEEGFIIDSLLKERIKSSKPGIFLKLDNCALMPGSLNVIDSDPLTISKYLRENIENGS